MSPACLTLVHPPHNTRASHMSRLSRRYTRAVYSVRVRLALRSIHGLASSCTHAVHLVRAGWGGVGWGGLVAGGRCARPAWPAPEMGRSGAGPWAARCCRGGRPGAMPGRQVEEHQVLVLRRLVPRGEEEHEKRHCGGGLAGLPRVQEELELQELQELLLAACGRPGGGRARAARSWSVAAYLPGFPDAVPVED